MFSQASIILSTVGGGGCVAKGGVHGKGVGMVKGGMLGRGRVCVAGVCMAVCVLGMGGHAW